MRQKHETPWHVHALISIILTIVTILTFAKVDAVGNTNSNLSITVAVEFKQSNTPSKWLTFMAESPGDILIWFLLPTPRSTSENTIRLLVFFYLNFDLEFHKA
jgi:hypothetical protein